MEKIIRETEERAFLVEKTDPDQARRIREKIVRLRVSFVEKKNISRLFIAFFLFRIVWKI